MEPSSSLIYPQRKGTWCSLSHLAIKDWLGARGVWFPRGYKLKELCSVILHADGWLFIKLSDIGNELVLDSMDILFSEETVVVIRTHKLESSGLVTEVNESAEAQNHISIEQFKRVAETNPIDKTLF